MLGTTILGNTQITGVFHPIGTPNSSPSILGSSSKDGCRLCFCEDTASKPPVMVPGTVLLTRHVKEENQNSKHRVTQKGSPDIWVFPKLGVPGTPKSSISIRFSIINHPFWGTTIFGNSHIWSNGIIFHQPRSYAWNSRGWSSTFHHHLGEIGRVRSLSFDKESMSWSGTTVYMS